MTSPDPFSRRIWEDKIMKQYKDALKLPQQPLHGHGFNGPLGAAAHQHSISIGSGMGLPTGAGMAMGDPQAKEVVMFPIPERGDSWRYFRRGYIKFKANGIVARSYERAGGLMVAEDAFGASDLVLQGYHLRRGWETIWARYKNPIIGTTASEIRAKMDAATTRLAEQMQQSIDKEILQILGKKFDARKD